MSATLNFGKHKGRRLQDVDSDYLCWVLANVKNLSVGLEVDIRAELRAREERAYGRTYSQQPAMRVPAGVTLEAALSLIAAGKRSLARVHHPDAGGDTATMQSVNAVSDWLS